MYDPSQVEKWREAARRGDPIIRPLEIYSRIQYRCKACGGEFMGDAEHMCAQKDGRPIRC